MKTVIRTSNEYKKIFADAFSIYDVLTWFKTELRKLGYTQKNKYLRIDLQDAAESRIRELNK